MKYENINTCEVQESNILKSSFINCGTVLVTKENITNGALSFSQMKESSPLHEKVQAVLSIEKINLDVSISGFLTIGKANVDDNFVYWDRKWCILEGSSFYVYNYPQERELEKLPEVVIDLKSALEMYDIADKCPRRKSFIITRKSQTSASTNFFSLKHRNNSYRERYLLAADDRNDVGKWSGALNFVMESLEKWSQKE